MTWWRFQPVTATWRQLAKLTQIPNDQIRAGEGGRTREQQATASKDFVSVRLRCTVEGNN